MPTFSSFVLNVVLVSRVWCFRMKSREEGNAPSDLDHRTRCCCKLGPCSATSAKKSKNSSQEVEITTGKRPKVRTHCCKPVRSIFCEFDLMEFRDHGVTGIGAFTTPIENVQALPKQGAEVQYDTQTCKRSPATLHIIGDTHADENYLWRTMVSTGLFTIRDKNLVWKSNLRESDNFEVAILGDMTDRGLRGKRNLLTLQTLTQHKKFGHRLKILLGNHESMLLEHDLRYASGDLDEEVLLAAHQNKSEEDALLLKWLRELPLVYLKHGVLMMHGGLSGEVADRLARELKWACDDEIQTQLNLNPCGQAMIDRINGLSPAYFEEQDRCIKLLGSHGMDPSQCQALVKVPKFLDFDNGVLWYRGYSLVAPEGYPEYGPGAGSEESCREANYVAKMIGAHTMAVAHTTHPSIQKFCEKTPVFATDTHFTDCVERSECDYAPDFKFHDNEINPNKELVPQSLRVTVDMEGGVQYKVCFSKVQKGKEEIKCIPKGELKTKRPQSAARQRL